MSTRGTSWLGPGVAASLLIALLVLHLFERGTAGNIDHYMAQVAEQADGLPYTIGPFVGKDEEVAPGAVRLLRPNRLIQRRYTNVMSSTREEFWLLFVHCGAAKDMNNHYPPNCYPNSGWELVGAPGDEVVGVGGLRVPAKLYRFRLANNILAEPKDILSFFVLPSGQVRFGGEMDLVDLSSRLPWTDKLGAGQVQVLTPASMPEQTRHEIWSEVLGALAPTLHTIAEGPQ